MPHHAVTKDNDFVKSTQDLTDLLGRKPAHVAASRHVGSVIADAAARGHGCDHGIAILA